MKPGNRIGCKSSGLVEILYSVNVIYQQFVHLKGPAGVIFLLINVSSDTEIEYMYIVDSTDLLIFHLFVC